MEIKKILEKFTAELVSVSETAHLDAELLLCQALSCSRTDLIREHDRVLSASEQKKAEELLERRLNHEPLAYITGTKEFWGLDFLVTLDVLIPRPETELLVELALKKLTTDNLLILDLGLGSACISIALAHELKKIGRKFEIIGVDKSIAALDVARKNAKQHNVQDYIRFIDSDWFSKIPFLKFDLIISNPPYIESGDTSVYRGSVFEPAQALYASEQGLADIKNIINNAPDFLKDQGSLILEFGSEQKNDLEYLVKTSWQFEFFNDLAGLPRAVILTKGH